MNLTSLLASLSLFAVMEFKDKTLFVSFILAALYGEPLMIFTGILLGIAVIARSGVVIRKGLMKGIPKRHLKYIAAFLFLIFGVVFLVNAFFGIEIL